MIFTPTYMVSVAYKKLKQMVYYEKSSLILRHRLAEFECDVDFERRLHIVERVISHSDPADEEQFRKWLGEIDYVVFPKSIYSDKASGYSDADSKNAGSFLSNVTSAREYKVDKVNYLFDGPIELHLIAVMWLMTSGYKLDRQLTNNCFGSRLHPLVGKTEDRSAQLFRKYHELYSQWRDDGLTKAVKLLSEEKRSICIIALDLQEFYYRVQVNWQTLCPSDEDDHNSSNRDNDFDFKPLEDRLAKCVHSICQTYKTKIAPSLKITHPGISDNSSCLPIGLCSSPVLANWQLHEFDRTILSDVRPNYYGRYVDDCLFVVAKDYEEGPNSVEEVMNDVLVKTGVLEFDKDNERYEIRAQKGLYLQKSKCVLQYFDVEHSFAGLEKFRKRLQENVSDFALLPSDESESPVEQVAYDILYDGSENKLRSVKEIAENRWELAKHLAKETQLLAITSGGIDSKTKSDLFRFFKGKNAIEFWEMWERAFSILIAGGDSDSALKFKKQIERELKAIVLTSKGSKLKTRREPVPLTSRLKQDLLLHLEHSFSIALALREANSDSSQLWRRSNLIRHHLVTVPLLNYTNFDGDFISPLRISGCDLEDSKVKYSPRFVHFDECVEIVDSWFLAGVESLTLPNAMEVYGRFHAEAKTNVKYRKSGSLENEHDE